MTHHEHDGDQAVESFSLGTFEGGRLKFVSGVFDEVANAEQAVLSLERRGYGRDQITVLMSDELRQRYLNQGAGTLEVEKGNRAAEGLGTGGVIGGTLGAIVGAVAAVGTSLIIPGLGLVVAGPLAAGLAGLGAGGAAGGILGALVGAGLPEYRAKYYEQKIKEGGVVVGVDARTEKEADDIEGELKDCGADDVKQSDTAARTT